MWIFICHRRVKRHGLASQTRGRNLRFVCERTAKFFNRILLLALVHNHTRQNDGRISLQKQTSNDKRQNNLTKLGINFIFVSEFQIQIQKCSFTLWSCNQHKAWFYVFRVLLWRVSCVARKHLPKENFTSFWRSFLRQFTYVILWNSE